MKPEPRRGDVLDAAEVRTLVTKFAADDDAARLRDLFEKPELDPGTLHLVLREEGWILGCT